MRLISDALKGVVRTEISFTVLLCTPHSISELLLPQHYQKVIRYKVETVGLGIIQR